MKSNLHPLSQARGGAWGIQTCHTGQRKVFKSAGAVQGTLQAFILQVLRKTFPQCKVLDSQLPAGTFWKYCQLWGSTTSWISFLASLTIYLETEALAKKEQVRNDTRSAI